MTDVDQLSGRILDAAVWNGIMRGVETETAWVFTPPPYHRNDSACMQVVDGMVRQGFDYLADSFSCGDGSIEHYWCFVDRKVERASWAVSRNPDRRIAILRAAVKAKRAEVKT